MRKLLFPALLAISAAVAQQAPSVVVEAADPGRVRDELSNVLQHYPPSLRQVLALDPALLSNQSYLAPYPGIAAFLTSHPEVARSPSFYLPVTERREGERSRGNETLGEVLRVFGPMTAFAMAICLTVWLVKALLDYRRWNRLSRVQADVHSKLVERFTGNEELIEYVKSPAGAKFLESSPIALDAAPQSVGAPLGAILFSLRCGLVLIAGGIGLRLVHVANEESLSDFWHACGVVAIAIGAGLLISAAVSFLISQRLGLIDKAAAKEIA